MFFFVSYALFILIQYPISHSYPTSWAFYGLLLPAGMLYAASRKPQHMGVLFKQPIAQAFLLLFAYVIFHELLFAPTYEGISKTLIDTADTTFFFFCSVVFFVYVDQKFLHRFFLILCILVPICALISIYLNYVDPNITDRLMPIGRARNSMLGAYTYGFAGIISIYQYHRSSSRRLKLCYLIGAFIIGGMIIVTKTRMAILTYTLAGTLLNAAYLKSVKPTVKLLLIAAILLVLAVILSPELRGVCVNYISILLARKDSRRIELWSLTLQEIGRHPLVGYGMRSMLNIKIDANQSPISPHSIYLATAYYLGIPGFLLFIYPLYQSVKTALRLLYQENTLGILASALLLEGLLATATDFGQFVKTPGPLWLIFWLPIAFVIGVAIRKERTVA